MYKPMTVGLNFVREMGRMINKCQTLQLNSGEYVGGNNCHNYTMYRGEYRGSEFILSKHTVGKINLNIAVEQYT